MARKKKLPRGLEEFEGSLHDIEYVTELVKRLLDLPEQGFGRDFENLKDALKVAEVAEKSAANNRELARRIAGRIWENAKANWTVKELQTATGYDEE